MLHALILLLGCFTKPIIWKHYRQIPIADNTSCFVDHFLDVESKATIVRGQCLQRFSALDNATVYSTEELFGALSMDFWNERPKPLFLHMSLMLDANSSGDSDDFSASVCNILMFYINLISMDYLLVKICWN